MIWKPYTGQRVRLRYRKELRKRCPHDQTGTILAVASGPKLINVKVILDDGREVVVPRGNLFVENFHGRRD